MMTLRQLKIARMEAVRFINRAEDAERKIREDVGKGDYDYHDGCKETGAARRSSLDLTRALADLRR